MFSNHDAPRPQRVRRRLALPLMIVLASAQAGCFNERADKTLTIRADVPEINEDRVPGKDGMRVQDLLAAIGRADRLVVAESPDPGARVIHETRNAQDRAALIESLKVEVPEESFRCMCLGSPVIYLYQDGKELGQLSNHHGTSVRYSAWGTDVPLLDTETWLRWFDDRGIPGPRAEYDEANQRRKESANNEARWNAAIPESIKPLWDGAVDQYGKADLAPFEKALARELPDRGARIRRLLEWYGSGAGPWSGYPSYEGVAEEMLLCYPTKHIVGAIEGQKLTPAQTEGAARLFGGWLFYKQRPRDIDDVPQAIKRTLWAHVKDTDDTDKYDRARSAFVE